MAPAWKTPKLRTVSVYKSQPIHSNGIDIQQLLRIRNARHVSSQLILWLNSSFWSSLDLYDSAIMRQGLNLSYTFSQLYLWP